MKKTKWILAVLLVALLAGIFALPQEAEAQEWYDSSGKRSYLYAMATCYSGKESNAKEYITSCTNAYLDKDLNDGADGDYIYIGWTTTDDPTQAITGLRLKMYDDEPASLGVIVDEKGISWYPANSGVHEWVPKLHSDGCADLNYDAGGKYVYLYVTKDPRYGNPVSSVEWSSSGTKSGCTPVVNMDSPSATANANEGAGGETICLFTKSTCSPFDSSALRSKMAEAKKILDQRDKFSSVYINALQGAYDEAQKFITAMDNNDGITYNSDIWVHINNLNNRMSDPYCDVKFDASHNGGNSLYSGNTGVRVQQCGYQAPWKIDVETSYVQCKSGYTFVGWNTDPNATTGQKEGSVTVTGNTTYYAIYRKDITLTCHYLDSSSESHSETQTFSFYNNEPVSVTTTLPAKHDIVDGEPFSWVNDQNQSPALGLKHGAEITLTGNMTYYEVAKFSWDLVYYKPDGTVLGRRVSSCLSTAPDIIRSALFTLIGYEDPNLTMLGWDANDDGVVDYEVGAEIAVQQDFSLKAVCQCDVTFVGRDGAVISQQTVPYGAAATAPAHPGVPANGRYHFVANGWDKDYSNITAHTTITARYQAVPHTWENSVCTVCGYECVSHSYTHDGTGKCTLCGKPCDHWWEEGECWTCGLVCTHQWEDGDCTICGWRCDHQWEDSVCTVCGYHCDHWWRDSVCFICGKTCTHTWVDGACTVCGADCSHTWENNTCTVCGEAGVTVYFDTTEYLYNYASVWKTGSDSPPLEEEMTPVEGEENLLQYTFPSRFDMIKFQYGYYETKSSELEVVSCAVYSGEKVQIIGYRHDFADGKCRYCGAASYTEPTVHPMGAGLAFKDEIRYNVYFTVENPDDIAVDHMGLICWTSPIDGDLSNCETESTDCTAYGNGWKIVSPPIPAKNMGEELYFKIYVMMEDGNVYYSDLLNYSAKTYCTNMLASESASEGLKALCVSLMNYGAAAQEYFAYKTDELMNADLTPEQKALVAEYSDDMIPPIPSDFDKEWGLRANDSFSAMYPLVNFGDAFSIKYHFTSYYPVDGEQIKLYVWTAKDYAAAETLTLENASQVITMAKSDTANTYTAAISGIAAKNGGDAYYVCGVYERAGVTYFTGVLPYSVSLYCQNIGQDTGTGFADELGRATGVYIYYAAQYFQ